MGIGLTDENTKGIGLMVNSMVEGFIITQMAFANKVNGMKEKEFAGSHLKTKNDFFISK